ncbi:unnamed protein product [Sphagnum jensenii]|uniref:Uncharacterized protein n=1 Tax=Sphagnum jensenii TaxID=128206 RepID=A0ABP1C2A1_9BRYO
MMNRHVVKPNVRHVQVYLDTPYNARGEELETEKQDWSNGGSYSGQSPSPRSLHTATCVGEKIVVFGGQEDNSAKNDVFIFNTVAERW